MLPSHLPSQRELLSIPWKGSGLASTGFVEHFLELLAEGGSIRVSHSYQGDLSED